MKNRRAEYRGAAGGPDASVVGKDAADAIARGREEFNAAIEDRGAPGAVPMPLGPAKRITGLGAEQPDGTQVCLARFQDRHHPVADKHPQCFCQRPEACLRLAGSRLRSNHTAEMSKASFSIEMRAQLTIPDRLQCLVAPDGTAALDFGLRLRHNLKPLALGADEVMDRIAKNNPGAAELYVRTESWKQSADEIFGYLQQEDRAACKPTPGRTMAHAEFMHKVRSLKSMLESWNESFWENVHGRPGS